MILAVNGFAPGFGAFENKVLTLAAHASLSRPLTEAEQAAYGVAEDWGMTPANSFVGITMRHTSDRRLLIREQILYRPGMRVTEEERRQAALRHKRLFDARFPMLPDVEMAHTWSGLRRPDAQWSTGDSAGSVRESTRRAARMRLA